MFTEDGNALQNPISSVCLAITLMKHLRTVEWLSKDVILVLSDASFEDEGIREWLSNYHNYVADQSSLYFFKEAPGALYRHRASHSVYSQLDFVRSGAIRGALVLDFFEEQFNYIVLSPEGINGKLPNLDLMNTFDRVAMYSENAYTTLYREDDTLTRKLFGVGGPLEDLPLLERQLYAFILRCAIGKPSGNHGHFLQYNIDAITARLMPKTFPGNAERPMSVFQLARIVEGTVRSLSNLNEHFHQSFYYYVLAATFSYISIGQYMITFGMVLGSTSLYLGAVCIGEDLDPWILRGVTRSLIIQVSGPLLFAGILYFPPFVSHSNTSETFSLRNRPSSCSLSV